MSPFQSLLSVSMVSLSLAVSAAPMVSAQTPSVPFNSMPNILQDYIYGYAPVAMAATRALMTAVPNATTLPGAAPVNQFGRVKALATPSERLIPKRIPSMTVGDFANANPSAGDRGPPTPAESQQRTVRLPGSSLAAKAVTLGR
jgi:hypothetical protein